MTPRRRRQIPDELIAHLLSHTAALLWGARRPAEFRAQMFASVPSLELRDALSATFADADALLLAGEEVLAAQLHEAAAAKALLATHQLSLGDIAVLDTGRHFERDRQRRIRRIKIPACESSLPLDIDILVPEYFAERLERHLQVFRPHLPGAEESMNLFPAYSKTHLTVDELRVRLSLLALWSHATTTGA